MSGMNEQMKRPSTSNQSDLPPKRGRGRPRRDDTTSQPKYQQLSHYNAAKDTQNPVVDQNNEINDNLLGHVVHGVIDGSFESGYFISVKAENNILMRGVVFHPQMINHVSNANDVAPNAKMFERKEFPNPVIGLQLEADECEISKVQKDIENKSHMAGNGSEEKLKYEANAKISCRGDISGCKEIPRPIIFGTDFSDTLTGNTIKNIPIVKGFECGVQDLSTPRSTDVKISTEEDEVMQEKEDLNLVKRPRNEIDTVDEEKEHIEEHFDYEETKQMTEVNAIETRKAVAQSESESEGIQTIKYAGITRN